MRAYCKNKTVWGDAAEAAKYKNLVAFDFELGQYLTGEAAAHYLLREHSYAELSEVARSYFEESAVDSGSFVEAWD